MLRNDGSADGNGTGLKEVVSIAGGEESVGFVFLKELFRYS